MEEEKMILEKQVKKSDLRAADIFDYEYLMKETVGLVPCKIEQDGENIVFQFQMEGLHPLCELKQEEMEYRYRFLQNFYLLRGTWDNYKLGMDEENIYFDRNYMPYIAVRDIRDSDESNDNDGFFATYLELAAGIISYKYGYDTIRESGIEIIRKDKKAAFLLSCENIESLYEQVSIQAQEEYRINKDEKIRLNKVTYQIKMRILLGSIVFLLAILIYTGYQTLFVLPKEQAVIRASRAYTVQNYVDCIDQLSEILPEKMDTYTKYILAVSYAKSEALEKAELTNVLERLNIYSNEVELEYWIAVGRSNHKLAENYAKALSDDKLLIYAYMKELNYLEGNVDMDGEEKQSRMNELSNAITEIGKKYTDE